LECLWVFSFKRFTVTELSNIILIRRLPHHPHKKKIRLCVQTFITFFLLKIAWLRLLSFTFLLFSGKASLLRHQVGQPRDVHNQLLKECARTWKFCVPIAISC
jgi:hypothetical protein